MDLKGKQLADPKAPRFGKKGFIKLALNDNVVKKTGLSFKELKNIWSLIADELITNIIENPHGVRLSLYNGDFTVRFTDIVNGDQNRPLSLKLQKHVPFLNFSGAEKVAKIIWSIDHARKFKAELRMYGFKSCREFNKRLNRFLKETPNLYREIRR